MGDARSLSRILDARLGGQHPRTQCNKASRVRHNACGLASVSVSHLHLAPRSLGPQQADAGPRRENCFRAFLVALGSIKSENRGRAGQSLPSFRAPILSPSAHSRRAATFTFTPCHFLVAHPYPRPPWLRLRCDDSPPDSALFLTASHSLPSRSCSCLALFRSFARICRLTHLSRSANAPAVATAVLFPIHHSNDPLLAFSSFAFSVQHFIVTPSSAAPFPSNLSNGLGLSEIGGNDSCSSPQSCAASVTPHQSAHQDRLTPWTGAFPLRPTALITGTGRDHQYCKSHLVTLFLFASSLSRVSEQITWVAVFRPPFLFDIHFPVSPDAQSKAN
jgi:hypothetical protein